jgi:hypothetical protein
MPRPPEFDGTRKLDLLKAPTAGLVAMLRAARRAERERIAAFVQALPEFDEHRNGFSDLIDRNEAATAIRALGDE